MVRENGHQVKQTAEQENTRKEQASGNFQAFQGLDRVRCIRLDNRPENGAAQQSQTEQMVI